jgi:hypothetical protein
MADGDQEMKGKYTKRHRRTARQVMRYGKNAKRKHHRKAGRTGMVFKKQTKA